MNRKRHTHKRYKLKKSFKLIICTVLFLALFLTYGLWPRESNRLSNPFEVDEAQAYGVHETVCYKPIENEYIYNITDDERELLLKLVYREAGIESIECQMAVLQVVFNRVASDSFKDDNIYDIVYEDGQFEPTCYSNFESTVYNDENVEALERVLEGEKIIPDDVLYFWSTAIDVNTQGTWFYYMHQNRLYTQIDNTYFYF